MRPYLRPRLRLRQRPRLDSSSSASQVTSPSPLSSFTGDPRSCHRSLSLWKRSWVSGSESSSGGRTCITVTVVTYGAGLVMPNARQQEVIPRTIYNMIKDQVVLVVLNKFKLPLSKRATLAEIRSSAAALMSNSAFCPNVECGAGAAN